MPCKSLQVFLYKYKLHMCTAPKISDTASSITMPLVVPEMVMNEEVDQTPAGKELSLLLHARKCSIYLKL